jgi:hypothetical protein
MKILAVIGLLHVDIQRRWANLANNIGNCECPEKQR